MHSLTDSVLHSRPSRRAASQPAGVTARWRWAWRCAVVLTGAALAACGGGSTDSTTPVPVDPLASTASLSGSAIDALTGAPLSGVTITVGNVTTTTGNDGRFALPNAPAGERVVVRGAATGYAPNFETAALPANGSGAVQLTLQPEGARVTLSGASGGEASVPGTTARVTLPANAVARADGSLYTGSVTVQLAIISPANNLNAMPGDLLAATSSGTQPIESFGALSVVLTGSSGEALNVAAGQRATVRIPVSTRTPQAAWPATIPLYYFNESTGLWVAEGSASLAAAATYYEGTVSHFTVWNADQPLNTVYYTGCLQNEAGQRVAGGTIFVDGIDYSSSSRAVTNSDGVFTVAMKKNGTATVLGLFGAQFSNTGAIGPYAADTSVLDTCLTLGTQASSLSITLSWGALPEDVDSHLFAPDGSHVYYNDEGSLTAKPFAALDVDDTDSFGPEVITLRRLMVGTYRYVAHKYSDEATPGLTASPVQVVLNLNGSPRTFVPAAGEATGTDWWSVFNFTVDAQCNVTVTPVQTWSTSAPATGSATEPVYCQVP